MSRKKNKNIIPISKMDELINEVNYNDFEYKKYFYHLCNLIPEIEKEKLNIEYIDKSNKENDTFGLVYIFVIEDKIFKIGHTINSIKKRIESYNCGKVEYRIKGTNSTTNYFVLQSLLKINKIINVYTFFPENPQYKIFGKIFKDSFPPSKRAENEILKNFIKKYNRKPIGCTQT